MLAIAGNKIFNNNNNKNNNFILKDLEKLEDRFFKDYLNQYNNIFY